MSLWSYEAQAQDIPTISLVEYDYYQLPFRKDAQRHMLKKKIADILKNGKLCEKLDHFTLFLSSFCSIDSVSASLFVGNLSMDCGSEYAAIGFSTSSSCLGVTGFQVTVGRKLTRLKLFLYSLLSLFQILDLCLASEA